MIIRELERGSRTYGLLSYLYGPGRANEHTNQHMVAAWSDHVLDPARSSGTNLDFLAMQLDMPVHAMKAKALKEHVWHGVIALPDGDRQLTDAEWRTAAEEAVEAAGLVPAGDMHGVRWVAIKHADDHVHIVATLARQDGRRATSGSAMKNNHYRMVQKAHELEERFGLQQTNAVDRTAGPRPTRGEMEKAKRNDREATPREILQGRVRQAAAVATSDEQFFSLIERSGTRLQKRTAPDGRVTGYAVALPGDRTGGGRAVWFSGSKLAPDLSLPRVRERWSDPVFRSPVPEPSAVASRAEAWQRAAEHVHQAAAVLGQAGNEAGAGEMAALSDFLTTFSADAPTAVRDEIRSTAQAFERAGRAPLSRQMSSEASAHLRAATQLVAMGAAAVAGGGEAAAAVALLVALALAVAAAVRWQQAHQFRAQEAAAAAAGHHLRAATEIAYGATTGANGRRGAQWHRTTMEPGGPELTAAYEPVVRAVLPRHAEAIISEAAWPALAATLRTVENAGYDPGTVLAQVAGSRGFGDADSVAEVLVWRLQRRMEHDAQRGITPTPAIRGSVTESGTGGNLPTGLPGVPSTRPGQDPDQSAQPVMPPVVRTAKPTPADPGTRLGADDDAPTFADAVRQAVPEHAAAVLADPASAALAASLTAAAGTGYQPAELLAAVAAVRELDSADSVAEVLTWRVQGRMRRDQQPAPRNRTAQARTKAPRPPAPTRTQGELSAAQRAAQEAARRRSGPGRGR